MTKHWMASLLALLSCYFVNACKKGDGWDEYKYRDAGFAISAPFMPVPARPSPEEPNTRAYAINDNSRTGIVISAGPCPPQFLSTEKCKNVLTQSSLLCFMQ